MNHRKSDQEMNIASMWRANRRRLVQAGVVGAAGLASMGGLQRAAFAQDGEPVRGGRLRVASTGQPAGLDNHFSGQRTVTMITWNMYEALFTFDKEYATVPMLAKGMETSKDGLTNTISLRQGVPFHNGEEMKAQDVVASFERWMPVSALGIALEPFFESITAVDDSTVELVTNQPVVALSSILARQAFGLSIHPKSVLDAAGDQPLNDEG